MPQPVSRIGDIGMGTCPCHKNPQSVVGTVLTGFPTVIANTMGKAIVGSIVMCSCGHVASMILGNWTVLPGGTAQCRLGDMFMGCPTGTLVVGSPDVLG